MADFDKLWNYMKPAETAEKFLELLYEPEVIANISTKAQLYTQLARTQGLQNNWEEAFDYLNKAKTLLNKADKVAEVRYLLEWGRVELSKANRTQDDNSVAYDLFDRAWNLAKAIQADGYAVDAAHMLAIAADGHQATLDWNLKALAYAEQSSQPDAQYWAGSLYNNIGWTYFEDGDHEKALDMFEKALIVREKQKGVGNIHTAKWCIARVQRELGQVETALETQLALLKEHEQMKTTDEYVFEELAHCFAVLGDANNATIYAKLAHEKLSKDDWMVKNEPTRLQALVDLM